MTIAADSIIKNVKFFTVLVLFISLFSGGCQSLGSKGGSATKPNRDLEEANKKIEELYLRLSVVQFAVDNHERTLNDIKKKLDIPTPTKADSKPAETVSNAVKPEVEESSDENEDDTQELTAIDAKAPKTVGALKTPQPVVKPSESSKKTENTVAVPSIPKRQESVLAFPSEPEVAKKSPTGGESPETLYNKGFSALKNKNYAESESLFTSLVTRFPNHRLAVNSMYWTGEIYYSKKNYTGAIKQFESLISRYPKGDKVPDALLKIGYSYLSMKDKENAVKYLKKVVVDFPFTESGGKAEATLNRIE
jgi:tol-pal system protein YbgF